MPEARRAVQCLEEYRPPLGERFGLRCDFNENTAGCSARVRARLSSLTPDDLARYPEREPVEARAASFLGLAPNQLLLTNGVDEAIHLLCQTYIEPGDETLLVVPTYSMYRIYAAAAGARLVSVPSKNFRFPLDRILSSVTERTRFIALANPNNPTGAMARREDLITVADSAPHAAVLIDEAYCEFSGQTLIGEVAERSNLFVTRTFSKAYGMAGLRIGILAGPAGQIRMVCKVCSPYNVNQAALKCLPEALEDHAYVNWYVQQVKQSRAQLEQELRALGIHYWPSHANFLLTRVGDLKDAFVKGMKQRGILVRDRSSDYGCEGCVRITVGTPEQTATLIEALRAVCHEIRALGKVPA
jgi:histidinol-phosphate aminotransferase